ncbi:DUF3592 domain-containing protein [Streptomyces sp. RY43-2]|uniref:DUF3592 domain-containing protein n=1 Tax=Streptomyces macrolidinus TaxID=2952607 RepID=A0ABT0Z6A9_9ACTN|nr:DUF3592 domain-containing protein [Streptomyces macrolidinus]MCN9239300.1 DUF3592 domain-containing protein [Streptomyces macrolidinus]
MRGVMPTGGTMDIVFYVLPGLIIAGALIVAARVVGRSLQLRNNWTSGLTAEARCVRTYTRRVDLDPNVRMARRMRHYVYEFTTRDGREISFEEANGPGAEVGDSVTVHYTATRPERATAYAPAPGKALVGIVGVMMFVAVLIAFCVAFMTSYTEVFAGDDLFAGLS